MIRNASNVLMQLDKQSLFLLKGRGKLGVVQSFMFDS